MHVTNIVWFPAIEALIKARLNSFDDGYGYGGENFPLLLQQLMKEKKEELGLEGLDEEKCWEKLGGRSGVFWAYKRTFPRLAQSGFEKPNLISAQRAYLKYRNLVEEFCETQLDGVLEGGAKKISEGE